MAGNGGRNTRKGVDSDTGLRTQILIENAKRAFSSYKSTDTSEKNAEKNSFYVETLISTDRFVITNIPISFAIALGIDSETDVEAQIKALGVGDEIKRFQAPGAKKTDEGRADNNGIPCVNLKEDKIIGVEYQVKLHTPIQYKFKSGTRKKRWACIRMPEAVSIPAFALFLARFAKESRMPLGFTTKTGSKLYFPTDDPTSLTSVDKKELK
ncbi:MAG: hypothetical protein F6K40_02525 [Okeania sp. SIO3I5]|uniref:hypothetical protein n=1 Tax=Okeania sp. SIO3I5 TaxID=2607805 RepID=UPI0013BB26F5|nr:hypothetical protein [Okeania sp. SIO3I5]NEQ35241.1 hypothetical protein [Okeania sp. SIO3I5]